jgi:hypothetical protein
MKPHPLLILALTAVWVPAFYGFGVAGFRFAAQDRPTDGLLFLCLLTTVCGDATRLTFGWRSWLRLTSWFVFMVALDMLGRWVILGGLLVAERTPGRSACIQVVQGVVWAGVLWGVHWYHGFRHRHSQGEFGLSPMDPPPVPPATEVTS